MASRIRKRTRLLRFHASVLSRETALERLRERAGSKARTATSDCPPETAAIMG